MWEHRNNVVHQKVEEKLNARESSNLTNVIIDEYNLGPEDLKPMDIRFLTKS